MDNYELLVKKIDDFIRKYYFNQLIRGSFFFVVIISVLFLLLVSFEYFNYAPSSLRRIFYFGFISITIFCFAVYILVPIFGFFNLVRRMDRWSAAKSIGRNFETIDDKILNLLQLKALTDSSDNVDLLLAGIDQKAKALKPFNFKRAIPLKKNFKYLPYLFSIFFVLSLLYVYYPHFISDPVHRVIHYDQKFEKPLPYTIDILNSELLVEKGTNFELNIAIRGDEIPERVFLKTNSGVFNMVNISNRKFSYEFRKVDKEIQFFIATDDFVSEKYRLRIFPRPFMSSFKVLVKPPQYTGIQNYSLSNTSTFELVQGSEILIEMDCLYTDSVYLKEDSLIFDFVKENQRRFQFARVIDQNMNFQVSLRNEFVRDADPLEFSIRVIEDMFPVIQVAEISNDLTREIFYEGRIEDDYGFHSLELSGTIFRTDGKEEPIREALPLIPDNNFQDIFHRLNFYDWNLQKGERAEYYFELRDNDVLNNFKLARSQSFFYEIPSETQIDSISQNNFENLANKIESVIDAIENVSDEIKALKKQRINEEQNEWDLKNALENLLTEREKLIQDFEELQDALNEANNFEEEFQEIPESILEKQELLQELFDELIDDETKALMEEIQQSLDNIDQKKFDDMLKKIEMNNADMEESLDRNLELFRQLEFDKGLNDVIDDLEKLINDSSEINIEHLNDKTKSFEQIHNKMDDLRELNQQLDNSEKFPETQLLEEEIALDMEQSVESMDNGDSDGASNSDEQSRSKMKKMQQLLKQLRSERGQESEGEDAQLLRELLQSLVLISFDQEDLLLFLNTIRFDDPQYADLDSQQFTLSNRFSVIEDSLTAIAKRQVKLKRIIFKETKEINTRIASALHQIEDAKIHVAAKDLQYALTSMNNLALLLSESVNNMQSSGRGGGSSNDSNSKPSSGSEGLKSMEQLQKQLMQDMKSLEEGMKNGRAGGSTLSESLVRMAARQAALRQKLQDYLESKEKEGNFGNKGLKDALRMMEQTERDLLNKKLSRQSLLRQQKIRTRLLRAEKAELEREKEERRESENALKIRREHLPIEVLKQLKSENIREQILKNQPVLKRKYSKSYKRYIQKIVSDVN